MGDLPTGTVTFLFTDIEGSTRLARQLRDRYDEALVEHRQLLRESFERNRGRVVDMQGDAFFVAFERAKDALTAALAARLALERHEWPEDAEVLVRFGLHTGEALLGDEGYMGVAVHRAARICAAGHGGQIVLSQATAAIVEDDEPEGVSLRDLGEYQLKGIDRPERIFEAVPQGVPGDDRPLEALELQPVILATKLARPPLRAEHIARGELLELVRECATRKLTLLTAPPGFGKTTLLAEWAAAEEGRVAWLSIDNDDNDPARFFAYVIGALRTVEPDVGARALAALGTPGAGLIDVVLPLLLNDMAVLHRAIVLVLDDYHVITNADIHETLSLMVERLPSALRLVLATRQDPPLPLGRLRARGDLGELRAGELRFSDDEARTFLNDVLGLGLSGQDVDRLETRTEGWPAALYLAALSLQGRDDPSTLIDGFAGDDRHLVDYLTAEVLARQPPELHSFLLRTSILKQLCGPLCDAVADRNDSARILAELERSNLLLIPLDTKREWYRYHQLFAELLQHELGRTDAGVLPTLHRRASAWHRDAGLIVEAANHATAAGDIDAAVELVGRHYPLFLAQGQLATVVRWLDALPATVIAENWLLCFAAAMVGSHAGRLDEAERWLEAAERAPSVVHDGQGPDAQLAALRAWLRLLRGDIGGTIAAARRAVTAVPAAEPALALSPQLLLGAALWAAGQPTEAKAVLEAAARTAQAAGLSPATILTLGFRAAIELDEGDAAQAEALAREAVELTHRAGLEEHPFTAMARIILGKANTRRGELMEAQEEIERGIQLAERVSGWHMTTYGLLALAEVRHREHETAAARRLLARARGMLEALPDPGAGLTRIQQTERMLHLRPVRDRDTASAPFWELSERELAVLRLLASRLSQREIAAELYVSFNTVKSHSRSIFRKLGVASRTEAVDRAHELGLL